MKRWMKRVLPVAVLALGTVAVCAADPDPDPASIATNLRSLYVTAAGIGVLIVTVALGVRAVRKGFALKG